jgi:hypothetical protein
MGLEYQTFKPSWNDRDAAIHTFITMKIASKIKRASFGKRDFLVCRDAQNVAPSPTARQGMPRGGLNRDWRTNF